MSKTRLAPALQVFQTLQRYPVIRPRRLPDVPIGCASRVSAQAARQSMLSLYHDLGVLVFAGCSAAQTERIGDILRQVVRWGGPGGAVTRLSWTAVDGPERVDGLTAEDFHEGPDEANAGRIKPDAILKLASCRLQQLLRKQVDRAPGQGRAHLQEVQVVVPGLPAPRGTILVRLLSFEAFDRYCGPTDVCSLRKPGLGSYKSFRTQWWASTVTAAMLQGRCLSSQSEQETTLAARG
ncbi:hypothetical protein J3459_007916 [Metarhizium acridum]|nr:hypothetical protein J3459_007916 [Metarhizium acridum]